MYNRLVRIWTISIQILFTSNIFKTIFLKFGIVDFFPQISGMNMITLTVSIKLVFDPISMKIGIQHFLSPTNILYWIELFVFKLNWFNVVDTILPNYILYPFLTPYLNRFLKILLKTDLCCVFWLVGSIRAVYYKQIFKYCPTKLYLEYIDNIRYNEYTV